MITVADYIFKYLADCGVNHVFMVVGGGAMFLNNGIRKETRIKPICQHHEQACAISAEGYARTKGDLSVVCVTSGPGGTNTITGLLGQWTDSVPVLYLSGQIKFETTLSSVPNSGLRQLGDQECNIIDIVKPITKYAKMITNPNDIKIELEKAIHIATTGRQGPVWLDIPLNVQSALINENILQSYTPETMLYIANIYQIEKVIQLLKKSKKPLIIAGHGITIANAKNEFLKLVTQLNIPVVTTFNGFDLISSDHPNFIGRIGTIGTRAGNFALQNSDLILCLGTRNNIRQISYDWKSFGKNAKKIIIDIDYAELNKKTIKGDLLLHCDVKDFVIKFLKKAPHYSDTVWLMGCYNKKIKYPVVLDSYKTQKKINPYYFIDILTQKLKKDSIIIAGNGTACVTLFQAGNVKNDQRIFWNSGCASMGYGLSSAIGACFLNNKKEIICIEGDGSIMMNLQELQTIIHYNLPIKIFILNNKGYNSIIQTQTNCFNGNYIGCKYPDISFPNFSKITKAFGIKYLKMKTTKKIDTIIDKVLSYNGSIICEVMLDDYTFMPKLSSEKKEDGTMVSQSLENMYPFLSKEELKENII